ncbi:hypothetical protein HaLaN_21946, partial [Haematococcus lacustris]
MQAAVPEDPDSGIEDRDEALQPDLTEAQRNRKPRLAGTLWPVAK